MTTVTAGRRALFADLFRARAVISVLREMQSRRLASTLVFVLMPDHLHWLLRLGEAPLGKVLQVFKASSARRINQLAGLPGPVWQRGYFDHALRAEEDIDAVARYILMNPIRAGLVQAIEAYPHWDCVGG